MKSAGIFSVLFIKFFFIVLISTVIPLILINFTPLSPVIIFGVSILIFALCCLLVFITIKPLKKILQTIENLKTGNLNPVLGIKSNNAFEDLANSFNSIASFLQQSLSNSEQNQYITVTEKNRLSALLSSIIDGIIAVDLSKNVVLVNKAAQNLTGFIETELINHPLDQFIHIFDGAHEVPYKEYCQIDFGNSSMSLTRVATLVGKGGKQTKVTLSTSPITQGTKSSLGCILTLHDLSKEEGLEQMKLDFVSMASHELRTPLTSIIGYLSVFSEENKGKIPQTEMELVDRSLVSSKQLLALVSNLLSVNKIEKEQLSLSKEPVDWQAVLQKSVEDMQNQAKLKNIDLKLIQPSTPLPKVLADPLRTAEVVNNLVANAINYTNAEGKITVSTNVSPNDVITTVSDNGIGIPKESIPHLFTKFYRVSNQLQKANKGTGLGLYISKSIIDKLGGKIWVESEVGKGTSFHFSLPLATSNGIQSRQFVSQAIHTGSLNY